MSMTFHTTVNTRQLDRLKSRLTVLRDKATVVGWPAAGSPLHKVYDSKGALTTGHLTVAQTAAVHEFGSPSRNLPARPTMRETIRVFKRDLPAEVANIYRGVLRGTTSGEQALDHLGGFWEGRVKQIFTRGRWEPLDVRRTIRNRLRRGNTSMQPMVDSGHLRQTVTHKMVGAGYQ